MTAQSLFTALSPDAEPMPPPQPGDWRADYPNEVEPTFATVSVPRNAGVHANSSLALYATPEVLIDFPGLADCVASFLEAYFQVTVSSCATISVTGIAARHRRANQLRTSGLLDMLNPRRDQTDKRLVLTSYDLFHDDSDKFVFGVANHSDSKAVVSLRRYEIPAHTPLAGISLTRLLKITSHEVGHLFYLLPHCTTYLCNMNGKNGRHEVDRHHPITASVVAQPAADSVQKDLRHRIRSMAHFWTSISMAIPFKSRCLAWFVAIPDSPSLSSERNESNTSVVTLPMTFAVNS